ncbi:anti-sigma factor family protein [Fodinicurvata sediminis]|uniref:anti-sigma factor family protein n=1 Tax=Fodinicurvata sediminis TaxID=1121832 RepID=UPI0003B40DAF|nr:anti-sigma factor [Fodinicurvata sediminis]
MTDRKIYDQITELDLMAYVDGQLDSVRRSEVEAYLLQNPEENARVREYIAQNDAIRRAFDGVAEEPVPARLTAATHWSRKRSAMPVFRWAAVAASIVLASGGGWWVGQSGFPISPMGSGQVAQQAGTTGQAATAQQGAATPASGQPSTSLLDRLQQQPMIEEQAISEMNRVSGGNKFGLNFNPPDISLFGYELQNARQIKTDESHALHLLYADTEGETLSVMLSPRARSEKPSINVSQENDFNIVDWSDGPLEVKIVSRRNEEQLRKMAGKVGESMSYSLQLPQNTGQFAGQPIDDNRISERTLAPLLESDQISTSSGPM